MIIGGLQKFSLLDYPGLVSAIVFTQGCNFRCRFCYNPMLICQESGTKNKKKQEKKSEEKKKTHSHLIDEDEFFAFLEHRIGKIDAVVISGGEPTLHADLPDFIKKIRKKGFKIKLDTNGSNPEMLGKLINENLLDYIAMDIKNAPDSYDKITNINTNLNNILKSVKLIMTSAVPYEFRTTLVPGLVGEEDIENMGEMIADADKWYLQQFMSNVDLIDEKLKGLVPYNTKTLQNMQKIGAMYVGDCRIR